jgi:hypothetical protein
MTAVEWLEEKIWKLDDQNYTVPQWLWEDVEQAKRMEKQQIISAGNSCAIKQHLHNEMIDKMSNAEAMVFTQKDNLTFGEEYYNETYLSQQDKP